jgi:phosphate transport system protein
VKRTILDAQLHEIGAGIVQLGTLVGTALEQALQALQSGDQALCSQVIASDKAINDLRFEVERLAFHSLVLQQPLGGRDLRFLSSITSITGDLERMGDNAKGIARLLLLMTPPPATSTNQVHIDPPVVVDGDQKPQSGHAITENTIILKLLDLGQEARRLLRGTMDAFERKDAHAAREIWQEDDAVDASYQLVHQDLMTMLTAIHTTPQLQQDPFIIQRMTYWLWIAHNLERAGDHCTNICERIVFFLEGSGTITSIETE